MVRLERMLDCWGSTALVCVLCDQLLWLLFVCCMTTSCDCYLCVVWPPPVTAICVLCDRLLWLLFVCCVTTSCDCYLCVVWPTPVIAICVLYDHLLWLLFVCCVTASCDCYFMYNGQENCAIMLFVVYFHVKRLTWPLVKVDMSVDPPPPPPAFYFEWFVWFCHSLPHSVLPNRSFCWIELRT